MYTRTVIEPFNNSLNHEFTVERTFTVNQTIIVDRDIR